MQGCLRDVVRSANQSIQHAPISSFAVYGIELIFYFVGDTYTVVRTALYALGCAPAQVRTSAVLKPCANPDASTPTHALVHVSSTWTRTLTCLRPTAP